MDALNDPFCGPNNEKRGYNAITASGMRVFPASPNPDEINLYDVALHLARTCRYAGGIKQFDHRGKFIDIYSVAQHSCLVSDNVIDAEPDGIYDARLSLSGLMHDAPEYMLGDMIRPVKLMTPNRKELEDLHQRAFEKLFDFRKGSLSCNKVKAQDQRAVVTERRDLLAPSNVQWGSGAERIGPWHDTIVPWSIERSYKEFVLRMEKDLKNLGLSHLLKGPKK